MFGRHYSALRLMPMTEKEQEAFMWGLEGGWEQRANEREAVRQVRTEMNSQSIADRITQEGWNYLAVGDQVYTQDGLSLNEMFKRFGYSEDFVVEDFAKWLAAKLKNKRLEKHATDCAERAGLSCDCEVTYPQHL